MFGELEILGVEIIEDRTAPRYRARGRVAVIRMGTEIGTGDLVDLSSTGCAFRFYGSLGVGDSVSIDIRGLSAYPATVMRRFDGSSFGVKFELSYSQQASLQKRLDEIHPIIRKIARERRTDI